MKNLFQFNKMLLNIIFTFKNQNRKDKIVLLKVMFCLLQLLVNQFGFKEHKNVVLFKLLTKRQKLHWPYLLSSSFSSFDII